MKNKKLVNLLILCIAALMLFAVLYIETLAKPQTTHQRIRKQNYPEMPLFQLEVEQKGDTYYLFEINLKATLVPRSGVDAVKEALINKTVYFLIDGTYVGRVKAVALQADFKILKKYTPSYKFKPGKHRVMAQVAHNGQIFMGNGTLNIGKGIARIQETTPNLPSIYYGYEGKKQYLACHSEGDMLTVSAKFTDLNHPEVPIVGAKVAFRSHAVRLSEAKTDSNGEAVFSYELTRDSMLPSKHTWTYHEGLPLSIVQSAYNFIIEENSVYNESQDWGDVYRTICLCPLGYTLLKDANICTKK